MKRVLGIGCILFLLAVLLTAVFSCQRKDDPTPPAPEEDKEEKSLEELERELQGEHTFVYTVIEEPTEMTVGEGTAVCSDCGLTTVVFLPVLSAENYEKEEEKATCTEDGYRRYTSGFGTFTVKEKALGHAFETTTVPATCHEDGYVRSRCARCGKEEERVLLQLSHEYEREERREGTCDTYGYTKYRCTLCGDPLVIEDKEYGHKFDEGVHVAVSCDSEEKYGYTVYTCTVCGETKTVRDETPSHIYNKDTGACDVCGEKCEHAFDGYVCSVCGLDIEERVEEDGFYLADENGNGTADVGENVYFGTYPQTIASKEETAVLREQTPDADGYYLLNGKKYVRKTLDQRLKATAKFSNGRTVATYADYESTDGVYDGYFYRVEPIRWTVAATEEDKETIVSDYILGVAEWKAEGTYRQSGAEFFVVTDGETSDKYANDWGASDLRAFLNGAFIERAFNDVQTALLCDHLTNNGRETNYYQGAFAEHETTTDRVYLAAYTDLFGAEETPSDVSWDRMKTGTDYAVGSGLDVENDHHPYFTRSVGNGTDKTSFVDTEGKLVTDGRLFFAKDAAGQTITGVGFLPLVTISLPQ